ncbi:response regulator [Paenibacillus sp. TRM 82003]|nr:response regulator [Paenibacillus sp. TRM 82003]
MIKLMIVEDERWEREGLVDFLDWARLGIVVVGTARDGIEGLERFRELQPDLIITDIRMPGMDGLEMTRRVKELDADVSVIVLSGFSDFDYARQALRYQVSHYVLKPVEEPELLRAVTEAAEAWRAGREKRSEAAEWRRQAEDHRQLAIDKLAADAVEGGLTASRQADLLRAAGFPPDAARFAALALRSKDGLAKPALQEALDRPALLVPTGDPSSGGGLWTVVVSLRSGERPESAAERSAARLIKPGSFVRAAEPVIGVGSAVEGLSEAWRSVRQAREAAEYGAFWGAAGVVTSESLERENTAFQNSIGETLQTAGACSKRIVFAASALDADKAAAAAEELMNVFGSRRGADPDFVRNYVAGVVLELALLAGDAEHGDETTALTHRELQHALVKAARESVRRLSEKREDKDEYVVSKVLRLIETSYSSTDLSLTSAAETVFLSPNYLGTFFKKATGRTFHETLTEFRMEKAKELLGRTDYKVARVAAEVGVPNASYFNTVFKQTYGMTPGEYQAGIRR